MSNRPTDEDFKRLRRLAKEYADLTGIDSYLGADAPGGTTYLRFAHHDPFTNAHEATLYLAALISGARQDPLHADMRVPEHEGIIDPMYQVGSQCPASGQIAPGGRCFYGHATSRLRSV